MASAVATPIERQLSTIAGIDQIISSSSTGSTNITVQFALDRNIDAAALDVQTALSAVTRRLPKELPDPPSFQKVNPSDQAVLVLAVRDPARQMSDLQRILDTTIVPQISTIAGVSQVNVFGAKKFAVRVQFDPARLAARGLTADDLRAGLASANSNTAVGVIANGPRSYVLDATGTLQNAAQFADVVIAQKNGVPVRVGDVANVLDSVENLRGMAQFNGEPAIMMAIQRQPGANVVQLVDQVLAKLPVLRDTLPRSASIDVMIDRSQSIRHSVSDAQYTLLGTALLVVLVIYLVLGDVRATIIPGLVLPIAAIGTFAGMFAFGYSLDNLSLLALTLATGFVVDDAIVVLENIVRHIEMGGKAARRRRHRNAGDRLHRGVDLGQPRRGVHPAALHGRRRRTAVPRVCGDDDDCHRGVGSARADPHSDGCSARTQAGSRRAGAHVARITTGAFDRLQRGYGRALDSTLRHRRAMLVFTVVSIGVAVWGFTVVPKGFFPTEDTGSLFVGTEFAADAAYPTIQAKQDAISKILRADPAVLRVMHATGTGGGGRMFAALKPRNERDSAEVIQKRLRKKFAQVPGSSAFPNIPQNLTLGGRQSSSNYQYTLAANDKDALYAFAPQFETKLRATPGFEDVTSDYQLGSRQARVVIDRDAASRVGVPVQTIRSTLYAAFGNGQVSTIYSDVDSYQVILEIRPDLQLTPDSIAGLYVRGANGATVPLSAVTRIVIEGRAAVGQPPVATARRHRVVQPGEGCRAVAGQDADRGGRERSRQARRHQRLISGQRAGVRGVDEFDADPVPRRRHRYLHRPRCALRELQAPDHHPVGIACGRHRRGRGIDHRRDAPRRHRHHRRRHVDRHRQEERHHDDRLRTIGAARAGLDARTRDPRGVHQALPPDHDDNLCGHRRRAAAGARAGRGRGIAPAARRRGDGRAVGQPGPDAVHHPRGVPRHRGAGSAPSAARRPYRPRRTAGSGATGGGVTEGRCAAQFAAD